jgi:hypothetical protein
MPERSLGNKSEELLLKGIGFVLYAAGALTALGGIGLGLYQCLQWLRDGRWTTYTVKGALGPPPQSTWGGVAQIIDWIWAQPLLGALIATGFILIGCSIGFWNAADEAARRGR